jgi:AhpD family alkylhydroperoxidase
MEKRIDIRSKGQDALKAMYGLGRYLAKSPVEKSLFNLVYFRVSQINGCAFCLDMHAKDMREDGESEQRLYVLNAWREAPFYSDRERAALAYAEELTSLRNGAVPEEVYRKAIKQFSEQELIDLTLAVITINSWNRLNLAFPDPAVVGSYHPGQFAVQSN